MLAKYTRCASDQTGLVTHVPLQLQNKNGFTSTLFVYPLTLFLSLRLHSLLDILNPFLDPLFLDELLRRTFSICILHWTTNIKYSNLIQKLLQRTQVGLENIKGSS